MSHLRQQIFTRSTLADRLITGSAGTVLFCPGEEPPAIGEPVSVDLQLLSGPWVFLSGVVSWRRTPQTPAAAGAAASNQPPGLGLLIDAAEQRTIDYLQAYAGKSVVDRRDGALRHRKSLRVFYSTASEKRITNTRDIHADGIGMYSAQKRDLGTLLNLVIIGPAQLGSWRCIGEVVRHIDSQPCPALGVRLRFPSDRLHDNFRSALRAFLSLRLS